MKGVFVAPFYTFLDCWIFPKPFHGMFTLWREGIVRSNVCGRSYYALVFLLVCQCNGTSAIPIQVR